MPKVQRTPPPSSPSDTPTQPDLNEPAEVSQVTSRIKRARVETPPGAKQKVPKANQSPLSKQDLCNRAQCGKSCSESNLDFEKFKEEMRAMFTSLLAPQQKELEQIRSTQVEMIESNTNMQSCIKLMMEQNEELKRKIEDLQMKTTKDKEHINMLEEKIEDLQRSNRKTNLEIKNMPKLPKETKENLVIMVEKLGKTINCDIKKENIRDIYRVPAKKSDKSDNTPIIVELSSTLQKMEVLSSTKIFNNKYKDKLRAKHLGATKHEETAVFISEQLTAKGARLFFLARDVAKSNNFKFCWTSYGRVYLRKEENTPVILVKSEAQIQNLMLCK